MMQKSILFVIFFACLNLFAQLNPNKLNFDFGTISQFNNDTAFFEVTNTDSKVSYLLPTHHSEDYLILVSSKSIAPGETMKIGIVYYTEKKGKFKETIPLYFSNSNTPLQFELSGNILSFHPYAIVKCPSMEGIAPLKTPIVPLVIVVKDSLTNKEISEADILINEMPLLYQNNSKIKAFNFNANYGKLTLYVESKGYFPKELFFDYTPSSNRVVVYLKPILEELSGNDPIITELNNKISDTLIKENTSSTNNESNRDGLNIVQYKPNHLIFLIDISGSMKDSNKLNYLKLSINKLVAQLRPTDYVSLVTYAGRSKVVFEFVNGTNKDIIVKTIDTLAAKGGSYGTDGLLTSYELGRKYFIEGANNQIFIATDGMFNGGNLTNQDLVKMARRNYQKDGIKLSAIGFGKDEKSLYFLKQLALNGKGNFITIKNTSSDLDNLLEEVKKQSLIE
jgi:Mg-chelatase subunit ChlD